VAQLRAANPKRDGTSEQAVSQVRSWLDEGINACLQTPRSAQDADLSAAIKQVLHLLQVRRALDGSHYLVTVPVAEIAPLLRAASPELTKALIERLDPAMDAAALAKAFSARPAASMPRVLRLGLAALTLLAAFGLGWGSQFVPGLGRGGSGAEVMPSVVATQVVEPTAVVEPQPSLSVSLDKPQVTLRPGERTTLTLVVRDANTVAETATLEWDPPAGITIDGAQQLELQDGRASTELTLTVDETMDQGPQSIVVNIDGQNGEPFEIALTVSGEAEIITHARTLVTILDDLLTVPVNKELTVWQEPSDQAANTPVTVASVRIIEWPSKDGFVRIRAVEGDNPASSWVKIDELALDPATIRIDAVPLKIMAQAPLQLAPAPGAAEAVEASGEFDLLDDPPQKGPDNQFWIHLSQPVEGGDPRQGWALMNQTTYRKVVTAIVDQRSQP
jgi:hypothetical protein